MSSWEVELLDDAKKDLKELDNSTRIRVIKALRRIAENPLPQSEGGYGKPLGKKSGTDLTGFMKVKLRSDGIRIVYALKRHEGRMIVVVIGMRSDNEVYREAQKRRVKRDSGPQAC